MVRHVIRMAPHKVWGIRIKCDTRVSLPTEWEISHPQGIVEFTEVGSKMPLLDVLNPERIVCGGMRI